MAKNLLIWAMLKTTRCVKNFLIYLFIYLFIFNLLFFLAALGLCCCVQVSSSCRERELLFVAVFGLLIVVASLVTVHRF